MRHPYIAYLANLPQFQLQSMHGCVVDLRSGAHVTKWDGGDESKHQKALAILWPGMPHDTAVWTDGEKYLRLQTYEAVKQTGMDRYWAELESVLESV